MSTKLEPFHFGEEERPLFGAFHPAAGSEPRQTALLFLPPIGLEYNLSHRTVVQLAQMLADAGFPILRFDYRGTGDSSGEFDACSIDNWLTDASLALEQLRRRCAGASIGLLGLRLGAGLAYALTAREAEVKTLVLWAPMKTGKSYLRELNKRHRLWLKRVVIDPSPIGNEEGPIGNKEGPIGDEEGESAAEFERLGFIFSRKMVAQLQSFDLALLDPPPVEEVLLFDSSPRTPDEQALPGRIESAGARITVLPAGDVSFWFDLGAAVPHEDLKSIRGWLEERAP
jgi:pimeloyl-ACP methyl ester carboxylesterase